MNPVNRCLTLCIASLALSSCKDVTPPAQTPAAKISVDLGNKTDADRIAANAYQHTKQILSFGHRQPASAGLRKSKDYVITELKKHGWNTQEQSLTANTPLGNIKYSNLIARYAPTANNSPWRKSVSGVIGAHIDSKIQPNFLGADDAASCVATLLALAEHLHTKHPSVANQLELVFFDGEESVGINMEGHRSFAPNSKRDGLFGSYHYSRAVRSSTIDKLHPYRKTPQFGIVLDMIGHENLNIKIPSDTPKNLRRSYTSASKKLGLEKHFSYAQGPILDDHYYMNEIANIPTIDIIGDFSQNKWWHTSADNIDIISEESLSMSIQMTLEILSNQL